MTNIIVIGAGVVGLGIARQLAARGAKVTILDASSPGGLGSRAAAGVAIPSVKLLEDAQLFELTRLAHPVLKADLASLPDPGLRRGQGILRLAASTKDREAFEARATRAGAAGWLGRWLDATEVASIEPALATSKIAGAFLDDDAHMVDTVAYMNALLHDANTRGVNVRLGENVTGIEEDDVCVRVHSQRESVTGDRLVIAAGAWSGRLGGLPALPVRPMRGQMMTVFHPHIRLRHVVSGQGYLAPWHAGQIVVGATEEDAGFAAHTTPSGLMYLGAVAARTLPILAEARVEQVWAGLRSVGPQGRPLIGTYPGMRRIFVATGHAGQGILTGALTGQIVAELLDRGRDERADAFDPARAAAPTSEPTK